MHSPIFNVLPETWKKEIRSEYSLRRWIVIACCLLFVEACCLVLLFPSWLVSSYKESEEHSQIEQLARVSSSKNIDFISVLIGSTNAKLQVLDTVLPDNRVVPVLDAVISHRSTGIRLVRFSYAVGPKQGSTVTLGGIAATRESLVAFVKSLQKDDSLKAVDLPVSNLAQDADIQFTITIAANPAP
jgi:hypothetical protein